MRFVQSQRTVLSTFGHGLFAGLLLGISFVACGSGGGSADGTGGSAGAASGAGNGADAGAGGASTSGGKTNGDGGRNPTGNGGQPSNAGSGGDDTGGTANGEDGEDGPGFDGVDLEHLDLSKAPTGCTKGFDADNQVLALELDGDVPEVLLSVVDGIVSANGVPCSAPDGAAAETQKITTIRVSGGEEANRVYLDGAADFGSLILGKDGGFEVAFGDGDDELVVLGSDGHDHVELGSSDGALLVDLNGDAEVDARVEDAERALITTGPMADKIVADGVSLAVDAAALPLKLFGGGANDELIGGAEHDELHGGIGNDVLGAGADAGGADDYDGGTGEDLVDYSARAASLNVTLDDQANDGEAGEGDNVASSVEDVRGSKGANVIVGSAGANKLWGGPAEDEIRGGDGDDFIYGGDGNDELAGESGDDFIYGEEGDDQLDGGLGDDLLDGFPGVNKLDGGTGDGDICIAATKDSAKSCEL